MPSDLTLKPDFAMETTPEFNTVISEYENGVEQRRPRRSAVRRSWTLNFKNRSQDDMETIEDLFINQKGAAFSFTWDNPEDGQTYTVRFKQDTFRKVYHHYGIWDFSFDLIQVL